eukprot:5109499-Amphidinium_carterae.1
MSQTPGKYLCLDPPQHVTNLRVLQPVLLEYAIQLSNSTIASAPKAFPKHGSQYLFQNRHEVAHAAAGLGA